MKIIDRLTPWVRSNNLIKISVMPKDSKSTCPLTCDLRTGPSAFAPSADFLWPSLSSPGSCSFFVNLYLTFLSLLKSSTTLPFSLLHTWVNCLQIGFTSCYWVLMRLQMKLSPHFDSVTHILQWNKWTFPPLSWLH